MFGGVGNWAKIDIYRDSKGVWNDSPGTLVGRTCTEASEGADQNRSWDMILRRRKLCAVCPRVHVLCVM
jgi:hypothetical protein